MSCAVYIRTCVSRLQRRSELENHSVDAATTSEAVGFITLMQELKRQVRSWEQKVEVRNNNQLIERLCSSLSCNAWFIIWTQVATLLRIEEFYTKIISIVNLWQVKCMI